MISREIRWLWTQAKPIRLLLLGQLAAVLATSLLVLVDPLILKWLIDDVLPWHKREMLLVAAAAYTACYALIFALGGLGQFLDGYISQRVMLGIRLKVLRHLQSLSADFYVTVPIGDTLHRMEQDVEQLRELSGGTLAALLRILVTTSLTLVILLLLSWKLTLVILPLLPLAIALRKWGHPRLKAASDRVATAGSARLAYLQDHLSSMTQVQLLRREAGERRRFARLGRNVLRNVVQRRGIELTVENGTGFTMMLGTAVVLGFGGTQVLNGTMSIGGLVAFYTYLSRVFGPAQSVIGLYSALQRTQASIRRIIAVLEIKATIQDPPHPEKLDGQGPLDVELTGIHFSYGTQPVLDGLSLHIEKGSKVAIVGFTGSGKTTVGRLLARLYDPQSGQVTIGGVPVGHLRLKELRRHVALVTQEPILFDGTIRENLLLADPAAPEKRLWEVLQLTQMAATIRDFPDRLETQVGVRGQKLSGGQKQRLAIARALLQKPRILILDEATSGLDGITERLLLDALGPLTSQMTILLIAHRLSAIRWADRILVLESGSLLADGPHSELHKKCSLYQQLCERQKLHEGEESPSEPAP